MSVVCDATPLHYLLLIEEIDLLRKLYGRILIPEAVAFELSASRTPPKVRDWIAALPTWATVVALPESSHLPFPELGRGEREAIALASQAVPRILLTADSQARSLAEGAGVRTIPTIRILSTAAELGWVDFDEALKNLQRTNFRVSRRVLENARGSSLES